MGRIFIAATYGGIEVGEQEPDSALGATTEAQEMLLLRDQVVPELRARGFDVISVPDSENPRQSIDWINQRARSNDVALGIHADAYSQSQVQGVSVFYIGKNGERKNHAQMMLSAFCGRLADVPNLGVKPDSATALGSLSFCRRVAVPSLMMEIGLKTNHLDRAELQKYRKEVALGITDGLAAWNRDIQGSNDKTTDYLSINLKVNDESYPEKGVLINGNVYVPIDLADRLGVNLSASNTVRQIRYRGVIYIKAIELRDFHISVNPGVGKTFLIKSNLPVTFDEMERLAGKGHTSAQQLYSFLAVNKPNLPAELVDLPNFYIEECAIEGMNHDLAFVQMCLETKFLNFSGHLNATNNNFANLGGINADWASFATPQAGVRAHVQQLKAYANAEPLKQSLLAPRFEVVMRGVAPTIRQLTGRWSTDRQYAQKLLAMMRRMYEFTNLF
jgi:N-acetylmuramoyl-L-alanine amidase/Mannosyl-glycoprotein endo-beta-N-acetylglucosaminidase